MKPRSKKPVVKTRNQIRKEQRKERKSKRYSRNFRATLQANKTSLDNNNTTTIATKTDGSQTGKTTAIASIAGKLTPPVNIEQQRQNEKTKQKKLLSEMEASRRKQLRAANEEEDRNIRQLEKLLHLNRRKGKGSKAKSVPKSFAEDGLGYLLEVCDPNMVKDSAKVDQALHDSGSDFEEDFAVVRGKGQGNQKKSVKSVKTNKRGINSETGSNQDSESDFGLGADDGSDDYMSLDSEEQCSLGSDEEMSLSGGEQSSNDNDEASVDGVDVGSDIDDNDDCKTTHALQNGIPPKGRQDEVPLKSKIRSENVLPINKKKAGNVSERNSSKLNSKILKHAQRHESDFDCSFDESSNADSGSDCESRISDSENESSELTSVPKSKKNSDTYEDIYGRTRDKDGNVIDEKPGKYIPPALRAKVGGSEDAKRKEYLVRLRRQVKGLINRLAENNMSSICSQMDELFMKNSRHDMNETLLNLILEALLAPVLTPERLVMEHMLLIAVLHANVGTEVGAHFLQHVMKRFNEMLGSSADVENKELDNVVLILSHLYNFKVFSASLMYEVLDKITETLDEKRIELSLVVLRSVGFSLRKDDPNALKSLVLKLQKKATECTSVSSVSSRVKFMLDILMAIKNNNMSKIPSYNPEHTEHLKKLLRTLVRRGNYVAELKITLTDLLTAEERGRWWIVGSAWTGHLPGENQDQNKTLSTSEPSKTTTLETSYSSHLLELARKQRMNTGVRKDIFCILMTAEDFMDAFEKLLHLNLKNQQRQEIVHVIFDCCLQEKTFNPYYAYLAQKFCDFDRQYQMKFQYCLWDKLKEVNNLLSTQLSNLAKLLAHLFLEKGLPISVLKVISFAEMDKPCVRLLRQIILTVLLSDDKEMFEAVFRRVALSPQLHLFREGLRLFINHFVLRKGSKKSLPEQDLVLLQDRARIACKLLSSADARMEF